MKKILQALIFTGLANISASSFAQTPQLAEILKKWVPVSSNPIGQYSIRAVDASDHFKSSLFKDSNGEYKWFMRVEYEKPKDKVAFEISNAYFNCDKSTVSIDLSLGYTKQGEVITTRGTKGGRREYIPITPDSVSQQFLDFVCKTKFD